ncbi:MAG TPA: response regulator, partial [Candidatus Deferrimicrobiaceae bacterium]
AAVQGIVRSHKGSIQIYSEPGKGSIFRILLPAVERPAAEAPPERRSPDFRREGTILLVDDEEHVRDICREMLLHLGFTVLTANDGEEALAVFREHPTVSCVILDMTMPRMDGERCFHELRALDPNVRVILSSGYSEHEIVGRFEGKGLSGFIQKPYTFLSLCDALDRLAIPR